MKESKKNTLEKSIEYSTKEIEQSYLKTFCFFIILFLIFCALSFLYYRFFLNMKNGPMFNILIITSSLVFSYFILFKLCIKKMDSYKRYNINMFFIFLIIFSFSTMSILMKWNVIKDFFEGFYIIYAFLFFVFFAVPSFLMSILFNIEDYIKYSYRYIFYLIFINFIFFCVALILMSIVVRPHVFMNLISNIFYTVFWCVVSSSIYSTFLCISQPLFFVSFFLFKKKSFSKETNKSAVSTWWILLAFYVMLPAVYYFLLGRYERHHMLDTFFWFNLPIF